MHNPPQPKRVLATLFGWTLGGLGFLLSFALSITVLVRQGNPGFLLIWLLAVLATGACMRVQIRWRKSCERMYAPETARTFFPTRRGQRHEAEDIAFRDIPGAAMSFSQ